MVTLLRQVWGGGPLDTSEKAKMLDLLHREAQLKSLSIPPKISTTCSTDRSAPAAPRAVINVSFAVGQSVNLRAPFLIVCSPWPVTGDPMLLLVDLSATLVGFKISTLAVEIPRFNFLS